MNLEKYKVSYDKAIKMGPDKFVKKHLFPFMRRENGNGFAMSFWGMPADRLFARTHDTLIIDGIYHQIPACNTFYCIGGSMEVILSTPRARLGPVLGITHSQIKSLFFNWTSPGRVWTKELIAEWHAAASPAQKEKVAEAVILHAIKLGKEQRRKRGLKKV